jgi:hypothetical protein
MPKSRQRSRRQKSRRQNRSGTLIFERRNYILLTIGVLLVAVGFALMRIDNQFLGTISLTVAPLIILAGYGEIFYAILWRPSEDDDAGDDAG